MAFRERFPIFQERAYINSCSYGALSTDVREAYLQYLSDRDQYGAHWEFWVEQLETTRSMLADFFSVQADEMTVTSSLSDGLNKLVANLDFTGQRNKVVLTDFDFPTTAQIWRAQEQRGAECVQVSSCKDDKTIPLDNFINSIDESTLLVSLPHVCYRNGAKLDIKSIIAHARQQGALVFLDCYQSVGTTPLNFAELDVDFAAGGMLKYLLSSAGVGFLFSKKQHLDSFQPITSGWFAQADVNAMDIYHNRPAENARKLESGTPNVPNLYAVIAGLKLVNEVGLDVIEQSITDLTGLIKQRALQQGYSLGMPEESTGHGALVTLKTHDMYQLVASLSAEGVITSCRDNNLRISPHFYNNEEDIDRLFAGLAKYEQLMKQVA